MTKFQKQMMTIAAIGALSAVTALPAMAADVSFYGQARLATFYNMIDDDNGDSTSGFDEHFQPNSRFGANFKNGDFGGKVEIGFGSSINSTALSTRLLYGSWNFGSGKLLVGQDYNRYWVGSAQVHGDDLGFTGYGATDDKRSPQIRVDMNNGFYFAAIQPKQNVNNGNQETVSGGNESYLPKLNVGYAGKAGNFSYNAGLVGQFYKDKNNDEQVTALLGYLSGKYAMGATSVLFNLSYAQNPAEMNFQGRTAKSATDDMRGFEGFLQLSQTLSPTLGLNAGVGYVYDKSEASGADADDKMSVFVNMPIKLAKFVTLTPEISYYDQLSEVGATDSDAKNWAVGAKWQIDF